MGLAGKNYVDITATDERDAIYQVVERNPDIDKKQLWILPIEVASLDDYPYG